MSPGEHKDRLRGPNDPRLAVYKISTEINSKYPAREHFFDLLMQQGAEVDTTAQKARKLLLSAWARWR
jgi:hypothetical protein